MYDDGVLEDVGDVMFMGYLDPWCPRSSRLSGAARDPKLSRYLSSPFGNASRMLR